MSTYIRSMNEWMLNAELNASGARTVAHERKQAFVVNEMAMSSRVELPVVDQLRLVPL